MTEPLTPTDTRPRSALPLLVALLALVVAGGALWTSYNGATTSAPPQERTGLTPPQDPAIDQIKQSLSSLQQSVQAVQSDQQKLSAQVNDIQQKQGDAKLLSDQLGALSARVDSLQSAKAETPAAPRPTQTQQRARHTSR